MTTVSNDGSFRENLKALLESGMNDSDLRTAIVRTLKLSTLQEPVVRLLKHNDRFIPTTIDKKLLSAVDSHVGFVECNRGHHAGFVDLVYSLYRLVCQRLIGYAHLSDWWDNGAREARLYDDVGESQLDLTDVKDDFISGFSFIGNYSVVMDDPEVSDILNKIAAVVHRGLVEEQRDVDGEDRSGLTIEQVRECLPWSKSFSRMIVYEITSEH